MSIIYVTMLQSWTWTGMSSSVELISAHITEDSAEKEAMRLQEGKDKSQNLYYVDEVQLCE